MHSAKMIGPKRVQVLSSEHRQMQSPLQHVQYLRSYGQEICNTPIFHGNLTLKRKIPDQVLDYGNDQISIGPLWCTFGDSAHPMLLSESARKLNAKFVTWVSCKWSSRTWRTSQVFSSFWTLTGNFPQSSNTNTALQKPLVSCQEATKMRCPTIWSTKHRKRRKLF